MTTQEPEDEPTLWSRAVIGDDRAFTALFDRHRDRVFGHALRSTQSRHDAEDVTALVFLELWRHRRRVQPVNNTLIGWLLVTTNYVVRNQSRSAQRHRIAMSKLSPSDSVENHADAVDETLDRIGQTEGIRGVFARLSAKDQDILTLCVLEELTLQEASRALKVPVGTVKSRLSRAKSRMASLMQALPPTSEQWSV